MFAYLIEILINVNIFNYSQARDWIYIFVCMHCIIIVIVHSIFTTRLTKLRYYQQNLSQQNAEW